MISRRFVPETFEAPASSEPPPSISVAEEDVLEDARLAGFEQGFKAGWEDCESAQKDAAQQTRSLLHQHLQEMSFGYHEAHGHILSALRPVLSALTDSVLPEIARQTLGPMVVEAILPLAQAGLEAPICLRVNPETRMLLEEYLAGAVCPPFKTVEDAALAPGAVILLSGAFEVLVDPVTMTDAIREIVARHFEPRQEKRRHG